MADQKISELDDASSVLGSDELAVVTDPSGTPVTKRTTVAAVSAIAIAYLLAQLDIFWAAHVDTGAADWLVDPSGANLAAALSSALPASTGGLGVDASAFSGVAKWASGTASASPVDLASDEVTGTLSGANMALATNVGGATPGAISGADKAKLDGIQKQGASVTPSGLDFDWSLAGSFEKTLSAGANTITFSNASDGQIIVIKLAGAASTVTWPGGVAPVKWPGGTAPTQTASGTDIYTFVKIGSTIYGSVVQAMA
jgi:hypothetical protein